MQLPNATWGVELGSEETVHFSPGSYDNEPLPPCSRCGRCCLSGGCWGVRPGDEVRITVMGVDLHICPHFMLQNGVATCLLFHQLPYLHTGHCGNHCRDDFPLPLDVVERTLRERRVR